VKRRAAKTNCEILRICIVEPPVSDMVIVERSPNIDKAEAT
jgi:hypothetical protein